MKDLRESVAKFLNDLAALPEERMRVELLGRRLKELGPVHAAVFLHTRYSMPDDDPGGGLQYGNLLQRARLLRNTAPAIDPHRV